MRLNGVISLGLLGLAALSGTAAFAADDPPPPPPDTAPPPSLAPEAALPSPPVPTTADLPKPEAATSTNTPPLPEDPEPSATSTPEPEAEKTAEKAPDSPPPSSEAPAEAARQDNVIASKHNGRRPPYELVKPNWGVAISASFGALGGDNVVESQNDAIARALEFQAEYQPSFLQSFGILGFGPNASLIPIGSDGSVTASVGSIWSVGGQVRYQARFFREQPFVPFAAFEAQYMTYHFVDGNEGAVLLMGPSFGGMLLLNFLEPSSAAELYIEDGIARSYLFAEYKMLEGSEGEVTVSGGSFYFGLRLEF